jgi:hypothetical protein
MRWTTTGVIFLLCGSCLAAGVAAGEPVARTFDVDHIEQLVFLSTGQLHLIHGADEFVRVEGPRAAVEKAAVRQEGRRVVVQGAATDLEVFVSAPGLREVSMDRQSTQADDVARQCELTVTDEGRLNVESIIAENVNIYLDGQARLSVESVTAGEVTTGLDAYGRVNVASLSYLSE